MRPPTAFNVLAVGLFLGICVLLVIITRQAGQLHRTPTPACTPAGTR